MGIFKNINPFGDNGFISDVTDGLGLTNNKNTKAANKANIQQAEINREFQQRNSNTAYQRAMEDMRLAGLNPTLAYMQGGASVPQGSQATVEAAPQSQLGNMALQAFLGVNKVNQTQTGLDQQQSMNESSITLNASTAAKNLADAEKIKAETKGLGKREAEGELWNKAYKQLNKIFDTGAKNQKIRQENLEKIKKGVKKKYPKAHEELQKPFFKGIY